MKNLNNTLKNAFIIGVGVISLLGSFTSAQAQVIQQPLPPAAGLPPQSQNFGDISGSYRGRSKVNNSEYHMVIRSLRQYDFEGGYEAILVQKNPLRIVPYVVTPNEDGTSFDMTPRVVTADGELIGVENSNPSLALTVDGVRDHHFIFSITKASDLNNSGFQGPIIFDSAFQSDLAWNQAPQAAGTYTGDDTKLHFPSAFVDNQATMILTFRNLDGKFVLREQFPGIYTYRREASTNEGNILAEFPSKIVVFLYSPSIFGSNTVQMFDPIELITPNCGQHVGLLKLTARPWNNIK